MSLQMFLFTYFTAAWADQIVRREWNVLQSRWTLQTGFQRLKQRSRNVITMQTSLHAALPEQ
jgi:hypothetical protein